MSQGIKTNVGSVNNSSTTNATRVPTADQISKKIDTVANKDKTPVFPVCEFPDKIQRIISELQSNLLWHTDVISAGVLASASVAVGNSVELWHNNRTNKPILWLALVMESGKGKSEAVKWLLKPLEDIDLAANKEYQDAKADFDTWSNLPKQEKATDTQPDPPGERPPKHIVGDITPETIYKVLQANPRGIVMYADELSKFLAGMDK